MEQILEDFMKQILEILWSTSWRIYHGVHNGRLPGANLGGCYGDGLGGFHGVDLEGYYGDLGEFHGVEEFMDRKLIDIEQ